MGGNYTNDDAQFGKQGSAKYLAGGVNPISNHNVDMYYPPIESRGYWANWDMYFLS